MTLLKEDLAQAHPEARGMLSRIDVLENEVVRLDAVLNDFMRYAGMRRLDRKPCDLDGVVGETLDFLGPGLRRDGIEIHAELDRPVPVSIDAPLFKQALLNILLNAQQALADGGRIDVSLTTEGGTAVLAIRDDGPGIPATELERVFAIYYSRSKAGSGLGLPTARRILEEHGGTLTLSSAEGEGTTVRMEVPVA